MAIDIAQLNIQINNTQVNNTVVALTKLIAISQRTEQAIVRMANTTNNAYNRTINTTNNLNTATGRLRQSLTQTGNAAARGSVQLGHLLHTLARVSAAAGVTALALKAVKDAATFEARQVSLGFVLRDMEQAKQISKEIRQLSVDQPLFDSERLLNAGRRLAAFGFQAKEIVPTLNTLADTISAVSAGEPERLDFTIKAFSDIIAKGKLESQELRQLAEQGIRARQFLSEAFGVTQGELLKLVEQGLIPGRKAVDVLLRRLTVEYGGAGKVFAQTTAGMVASLQNEFKNALIDVGLELKNAFRVNEFLGVARQALRGFTADLLQLLVALQKSQAFNLILGYLRELMKVLAGMPNVFQKNEKEAAALGSTIRQLMLAFTALIAVNAALWITEVALRFIITGNAAGALLPRLYALVGAVTAVGVAFLGFTGGTYLVDQFEWVAKKAEYLRHVLGLLSAIGVAMDARDNGGSFGDALDNAFKAEHKQHKQLMFELDRKFDANTGRPVEGAKDFGEHMYGQLAKARETMSKYYQALGLENISGAITLPPIGQTGLEGSLEGLDAGSAADARKRDRVQSMLDDLDVELSLIGKTNDERERAIALNKFQEEALEAYGDDLAKVNELTDMYIEKLDRLQEARKLQEIAKGIGDAFADAFTDVVFGAKSASEAIRDLAKSILKLIFNQVVAQPLANNISQIAFSMFSNTGIGNLFGAGIGGGGGYTGPALQRRYDTIGNINAGLSVLGSLPGFAAGGAFDGGRVVSAPTAFNMAQMGERGPEAIMPLQRDSRGRLGVAGGGSVTVNMSFPNANVESFRRNKAQLKNEVRRFLNSRS